MEIQNKKTKDWYLFVIDRWLSNEKGTVKTLEAEVGYAEHLKLAESIMNEKSYNF